MQCESWPCSSDSRAHSAVFCNLRARFTSKCFKLHRSAHRASHGWKWAISATALFASRVIATTVGSAKLRFSNRHASTTLQLASDTTTVSRTEFGTATGNLLATSKDAFLSSAMLDTKLGGRLSRLVATSNRTSTTTSMGGTKIGTTNCRLAAAFKFASLSTTMGSTEVLVSRSLVATWEFTSAASTMGNAESRGSLGAFAASWMLAHTVPDVAGTIWLSCNCRFVASLDSARLCANQKRRRVEKKEKQWKQFFCAILTFPDDTGGGAAVCPTGMQNAMPATLAPAGRPFGTAIPLGAVLGGTANDMPVALSWFWGTDDMVF